MGRDLSSSPPSSISSTSLATASSRSASRQDAKQHNSDSTDCGQSPNISGHFGHADLALDSPGNADESATGTKLARHASFYLAMDRQRFNIDSTSEIYESAPSNGTADVPQDRTPDVFEERLISSPFRMGSFQQSSWLVHEEESGAMEQLHLTSPAEEGPASSDSGSFTQQDLESIELLWRKGAQQEIPRSVREKLRFPPRRPATSDSVELSGSRTNALGTPLERLAARGGSQQAGAGHVKHQVELSGSSSNALGTPLVRLSARGNALQADAVHAKPRAVSDTSRSFFSVWIKSGGKVQADAGPGHRQVVAAAAEQRSATPWKGVRVKQMLPSSEEEAPHTVRQWDSNFLFPSIESTALPGRTHGKSRRSCSFSHGVSVSHRAPTAERSHASSAPKATVSRASTSERRRDQQDLQEAQFAGTKRREGKEGRVARESRESRRAHRVCGCTLSDFLASE